VVETADIEQHAAVAKMIGSPTVAAGPDADLFVVGLGVPNGGDHVVGGDRLHDQIGMAVRHPLIPDGGASRGFISVIAAEEMPSVRQHVEPL
jgi:hypothetical protein